jgi:hypothetical protein
MNDGKYFEKKTHGVISKLNPKKDVVPNVRIVGKLSESSRQLDVVMRDPGEYDFIAYECKDEKASIGTPTIEAYYTKLMDVGAKHGAIVSNSSYSRGARRMAVKLKIDLLNLVDTGDPAIKTKVVALSAVVHERVKSWTFGFTPKPTEGFPFDAPDTSLVQILLPDGKEVRVRDIANDEWNKIANGTDFKEGTTTVTVDGLRIQADGREVNLPTMIFEFTVELERRRGLMDITQSEGIYDVKDGAYQTAHLAIGPFSDDIFKTWQIIDENEFRATAFSTILTTRSDLRESHLV